jgi:citrate lyase synthetase
MVLKCDIIVLTAHAPNEEIREGMDAGLWWDSLMESDRVKDLGLEEKIITEWVLNKYESTVCTVFIWRRVKLTAVSCERGNQTLVSMKCGELLFKELLASQEGLCYQVQLS